LIPRVTQPSQQSSFDTLIFWLFFGVLSLLPILTLASFDVLGFSNRSGKVPYEQRPDEKRLNGWILAARQLPPKATVPGTNTDPEQGEK